MFKNMGGTDRIVRISVAIIIAGLYWQGLIEGTFAYILMTLAGVFVLTSLVSFCPLYSIFGIKTCRVTK